MSRLFVFGDSWAFNYFAKEQIHRPELKPNFGQSDVMSFAKSLNYIGHWTDYLQNDYDIYNYGEGGCTIEDVIHQLGYLDEYKEGDRIVIIFPNPERFMWIVKRGNNRIRLSANPHSPWFKYLDENDRLLLNNQIVDRNIGWYDTTIMENEKRFISKIPITYSKYKPLLYTWVDELSDNMSCIKPIINGGWIPITTESGNIYIDGHPGIKTNYDIFCNIGRDLGLDIEKVEYDDKLNKKII